MFLFFALLAAFFDAHAPAIFAHKIMLLEKTPHAGKNQDWRPNYSPYRSGYIPHIVQQKYKAHHDKQYAEHTYLQTNPKV